MRRVALTAFAAAGCLGPAAHVCDNGVICPDGLVCTGLDQPLCATQENLDACKGKPDRTACSTVDVPIGSCAGQLCGECRPDWIECRYGEWKQMTVPTDKQLNALWAVASNDVYAVGLEGTVLHYDGTSWSQFSSPAIVGLSGVWADAQQVFASSDSQMSVFRYTGAWQQATFARAMFAVWGASANDVFAVGQAGETQHFNGSMWSPQSNTASSLYALAGTSGTNVYASGSGIVQHYDGSWQTATTTSDLYYGVWADQDLGIVVGTDTVHAVIAMQAGAVWNRQIIASTFQLRSVWGTTAADVFAVGDGGTIMHFDGAMWTPVTSPTQNQLRGVTGTPDEVFAVGGTGTILRYSPR